MVKVAGLGIKEPIKVVQEFNGKVLMQIGVWNKSSEVNKETAIKAIKNSGYGADIYEENNNTILVSIPVSSDMY